MLLLTAIAQLLRDDVTICKGRHLKYKFGHATKSGNPHMLYIGGLKGGSKREVLGCARDGWHLRKQSKAKQSKVKWSGVEWNGVQ